MLRIRQIWRIVLCGVLLAGLWAGLCVPGAAAPDDARGPSGPAPAGSVITDPLQTRLRLTKRDARDPIPASWVIRYTIKVVNQSAGELTRITVTDTIPFNARFVSADMGGVRRGATVVWRLWSVPAGGARELHLALATYSTYRGLLVNLAQAEANGISVTARENTYVVAP